MRPQVGQSATVTASSGRQVLAGRSQPPSQVKGPLSEHNGQLSPHACDVPSDNQASRDLCFTLFSSSSDKTWGCPNAVSCQCWSAACSSFLRLVQGRRCQLAWPWLVASGLLSSMRTSRAAGAWLFLLGPRPPRADGLHCRRCCCPCECTRAGLLFSLLKSPVP